MSGKHRAHAPRRPRVPTFVLASTLAATGVGLVEPIAASASDDVNWDAIAACESGGNPAASDPSGQHLGMYQFSLPTWRANGGQGMPQNSSVAEQTRVAQNVLRTQGIGAWPVCGRHAYDGGAAQVVPVVSKASPASRHAAPSAVAAAPQVSAPVPPPVRQPDVLVGPALVPGGTVDTVEPGGCVSTVAERNHVDWQRLAEVNHLSAPYVVQPGQVLQLP